MATLVNILAPSGWGKTSSIVIGPDGKFDPNNYQGLNPATTAIINCDRKPLPFPSGKSWIKGKNVFYESDVTVIKKILLELNKIPSVKSICIDTLNGIMNDREMRDRRIKAYDKWMDLAADVYDLIDMCNTSLRDDIIVYMMGHCAVYEGPNGETLKRPVTNGKKLEKIQLETKFTTVLIGRVDPSPTGETSEYKFETQARESVGKSPIGMFSDFTIPNSLSYVEEKVRTYYGI